MMAKGFLWKYNLAIKRLKNYCVDSKKKKMKKFNDENDVEISYYII